DVDPRTDVWALGVLLYEALARRAPFDRQTPLATMLAVVLEQAAPLATVADVPAPLAEAIERALKKPRDERWSTAEAFGAALRDAGRADAPAPPPRRRNIRTSGAESRVVAVLLAVGVVDPARVRRTVEDHGGQLVPLLGERAIGLFGG